MLASPLSINNYPLQEPSVLVRKNKRGETERAEGNMEINAITDRVIAAALYHGKLIECGYRLGLPVGGEVIVELKTVERLLLVHLTQMRTYLKLSRKQMGLLLNFNVSHLKDGIVRVVNGFTGERPSANSASPR